MIVGSKNGLNDFVQPADFAFGILLGHFDDVRAPIECEINAKGNQCAENRTEHTALAHEFINYLLRPQVAADIATEIRGSTANAAARALLTSSLNQNPILYPTSDVLARGEWFKPLPQTAQIGDGIV